MNRLSVRIATRIGSLAGARRTSGMGIAVRWYLERVRQNLNICPDSPWIVRPNQVHFPLIVSRGSTSDLRVFEQIFVLEEYACLRNLGDVRSIVDLGANVGFSSAYFLSAFPGARSLAVEPFRRNFDLMRANLGPYGSQRVLSVHGAVWRERTRLSLADGGAEWAKRVEAVEQTDPAKLIEAYDVISLLEMADMQSVDLLKVDIEGAETAVFGDSASQWLPRIRNICVELHGSQCGQVFFNALKEFDYELSHSGELTICRNLRPK